MSESEKGTFDLVTVSVVAGTVALTAILGGLLVGALGESDEGEERPPVVVSRGGSIKFEAQDYATGHGEFKFPSSTNMREATYSHGKKPPKRFEVIVGFGLSTSSTEDTCPARFVDGVQSTSSETFETRSDITVTFNNNATGGGRTTMTVGLAADGTLKLTAGQDFVQDNPYTVYLNHPDSTKVWRLTNISFEAKGGFLGLGRRTVSCNFDYSAAVGEFAVFQRK